MHDFLWQAIINVSANLSVVNQELQAFTKFIYVNIYCIYCIGYFTITICMVSIFI